MNNDNAIEGDLAVLRADHRMLDERIAVMTSAGMINQIELARLKKRKLHLKDRIALLADQAIPDIIA